MPVEAAKPARGDRFGVARAPCASLDVSVLETLLGTDCAFVNELLVEFRCAMRRAAARMTAEADQGNTDAIGAAAHRLKSSARSVGALVLGDLCAGLETACTAGSCERIAPTLAVIEGEIAEVDRQIEMHLRAGCCTAPAARFEGASSDPFLHAIADTDLRLQTTRRKVRQASIR